MVSKLQKSVETAWSHYEREKLNEWNRTHIDLEHRNRKENVMEQVKRQRWSQADVQKLIANKNRPLSELVRIFKEKFTEESIEKKCIKLNLKTKQKSSKSKSLTTTDIQMLANTLDKPLSKVLAWYPSLGIKVKVNTLGWYRNVIKREINGIKTDLSAEFYEVLKEWYSKKFGKALPLRGSCTKSLRNLKDENKEISLKLPKSEVTSRPLDTMLKEPEAIAPVEKQEEAAEVTEAVKTAEDKEDTLIRMMQVVEPERTTTASSPDFYGILIGSELKSVSQNLEFVRGALSVYSQLGLGVLKIVKVYTQNLM